MLFPAGWTAPPQHIGEGAPAERLDLGCYSAHIFSRSVVIHGTILRRRIPSMLLSETQFSSSRIGAARTVCRPAVVIQRIISSGRSHRDFHGRVVIPHTFCSFAPPCPLLLFSTHFIPENNAVVIGSTIQPCWILVFCDFLYCYSAHILQFVEFRQGCYPQHNSMYSVFHSVSKLRIRQQPRQIQLGQQNPLRASLKKILILPVVIQRTFPAVGLLSGAQFPNCRILAAVVIDGTFLKKSTVQRTAGIVIHGTIRFFRGRAVVIRRTIRKNPFFCGASCRGLLVCAQFALQEPGLLSTAQYKDFSARVVIQRTFLRGRIFPSALLECCAHFSLFLFFAPGCYTRHFLKIPQNFLCRHFPAKKLFYRCYAPHIVAFYTFVLECCAQHRCNTAHICVGIFDIAILLF